MAHLDRTETRSCRPIAAGTALAGFVCGWVLFLFPPNAYAFYPLCPIHSLLGIDCPGCGATRALAALLHGQIAEAWRLNALAVALLPFCLAFAAECLRLGFCDDEFRWPKVPEPMVYGVLAVGFVFTVARNLT